MKAIYPILIGFTIACTAFGQETSDDSGLSEKVQKAIEEFNSRKNRGNEPEKEVVVVLPPPESVDQTVEEEAVVAPPVEEPETTEEEPEPVTSGHPADESAEAPEATVDEPPAAVGEEPRESAPEEKQGLEIRVESIREGSGELDPGQVSLKASFPAKSLSTAPDGWILEKSEQAPSLLQEVTLRPGKTISLSIRPHVLAPDTDGTNTFAVIEPGFNVSEGYRQSNTVSAILGNSVARLDRDALLLGNAISDLHQLLASLPKPETEPDLDLDPEDSPNP